MNRERRRAIIRVCGSPAACGALALLVLACSSTPPSQSTAAGGGTTGGTAANTGGGGTTGASGARSGGASSGGASNGGMVATGGASGGSTPVTGGGPSAGTGTGGTSPTGGNASGGTAAGGDAGGGASSGAGAGGTSGGGAGAGTGGSAGGASGGAQTGAGFVSCPYTPPADPTAANYTAGPTTLFNNDGAWTWYCDERAIVDAAGGKIIVGSDANGGNRNGAVEAVIYDVETETVGAIATLGDLGPDDHNTPALLVKPDGNYLAFWAGHNENCNSYWSNHNGTSWASGQTFDWTSYGCPFENDRRITYNNLWNMTAEGKIYNFVRSVGTSPNILVSDDNGVTWEFGGRLTSTPTVGYVAGYYKYWGNQVDRIDFFGTEAHPRDNDNNLYHGYIMGGKSYDSAGVEVDANISDTTAPVVTEFTRVFNTGTVLDGKTMNHSWNSDVMRYADGTIAAIGMARTENDSDDPQHAFLYFRFDGDSWSTTYLGEAGTKLYDSEQDYVGLGSLHPDDSRILYISTPFDPRDDSDLGNHEIFQGVTCDEGMTFQWTPITWNSSQDNLRPIVPAWDASNMVLLWFRGTYDTAQIYDEEVVGIITRNP